MTWLCNSASTPVRSLGSVEGHIRLPQIGLAGPYSRSPASMEVLGSPQGPPISPPLPSASKAFNSLLASLPKKKKGEAAKFVKKLEDIPEISLPPDGPIQVALSLADRALVGHFTWLCPSPRSIEIWVVKNWEPLIKNEVTSYFLGRGYFLFEFIQKRTRT